MNTQKKTANPYLIIFLGVLFLVMAWTSDKASMIPSIFKWLSGFVAIAFGLYLLYKKHKNG